MRPSTLYKILLATALAIGLFQVLFIFWGIPTLLAGGLEDAERFLRMLSMCGVLAGHVGLWLAMFAPDRPGRNAVWLIVGLVGWIGFGVIEGRGQMWQWIISFEEPGEWMLLCWPALVGALAAVVSVRRWSKQRG
ncbi:MAG: hypothetical protein ACK5W1_05130 [Flavobacteriales bacterium]